MSAAIIDAVAVTAVALYLAAAIRFPNRVPLPLLGRLLDRLPAPPELPRRRRTKRRLAVPPPGRHVKPLVLVFDPLAGRLRDADTGPMTAIPQRYLDYAGKAAEGWWAS